MKGDNLRILLVFTEYSQTNLGRNQSPFCTKFKSGVKKWVISVLGEKRLPKWVVLLHVRLYTDLL